MTAECSSEFSGNERGCGVTDVEWEALQCSALHFTSVQPGGVEYGTDSKYDRNDGESN